MGDLRRFDEFAKLIVRMFPERDAAIADVAGGKGYLQAALRQAGYRNVTSWDKRHKYAGNRRGYRYGWFTAGAAPKGELPAESVEVDERWFRDGTRELRVNGKMLSRDQHPSGQTPFVELGGAPKGEDSPKVIRYPQDKDVYDPRPARAEGEDSPKPIHEHTAECGDWCRKRYDDVMDAIEAEARAEGEDSAPARDWEKAAAEEIVTQAVLPVAKYRVATIAAIIRKHAAALLTEEKPPRKET